MRTVAVALVIAMVAFVPSADAATPIGVQRLDEAATATASAVRVDPPEPQPVVVPEPLTVEEMIRLVWPDNLEGNALRIAYRESRYQCCVRTWCCWGTFQIHRDHLPWLCREGLACTTADLYDPMLNIRSAYRLFQRDGWAPWSTG